MQDGKESTFIPLCVPQIGSSEWGYVKECLDTHWVSYVGSYVERFESKLQEVTGASHCVAMASGTAAIHLSLKILGVEPGTEVLMPAISFVSPANAVAYCGAHPTFLDIESDSWQLDLDKLERFLKEKCEFDSQSELVNRETKRQISALLPVHLLGGMCDIDRVCEIAEKYNLPVVEDGAEALGADYHGARLGESTRKSNPERRLTVTSFNGNKIITTGGGGAVICNSQRLADRAKHLSTTAKSDPIEFYHDEVGYNYRLSNVLAAIGVGQIDLLEEYKAKKREIAIQYQTELNEAGVVHLPEPSGTTNTFWMYTVETPRRGREVVDHLANENIQARPIWCPLNRLPAFQHCFADDLTTANSFAEHAVSIPCSVSLSADQQARVVRSIRGLLH